MRVPIKETYIVCKKNRGTRIARRSEHHIDAPLHQHYPLLMIEAPEIQPLAPDLREDSDRGGGNREPVGHRPLRRDGSELPANHDPR